MKRSKLFLAIFIVLNLSFMQQEKELKTAYFASGCFWCVEPIFESVEGVEEVISGYAGGVTKNPTYKEVSTGKTGHAETVKVIYNPKVVSFKTLLEVYYNSHNPTTKNGQYPDFGSQYRSIAFYQSEEEKQLILQKIKTLNETLYDGQVATEVKEFVRFYPAEDYHQNFKKLNPNNPYIKNISQPRFERFKEKSTDILKK